MGGDYAAVERRHIESVTECLNDEERRLRRRIMNQVIDAGGPVAAQEIIAKCRSDFREVAAVLRSLAAKKRLVLDEAGRVLFVYPVSALPTTHRVKLGDGRSFNAMCAIDAMGAAFALEQDTRISSRCSYCGEELEVEIADGQIRRLNPAGIHVIHVDLNGVENWASSC